MNLFDAAEVDDLYDRVGALRDRWIDRASGGKVMFYTLGRAAYLDFCCTDDPERDYVRRAPTENRHLMAAFGEMYERVRSAIQERLGAPVRYSDAFALPGFHIFKGMAIDSAAGAPVHFDGQYQYLPWSEPLDAEPPISFTMPIRLPGVGGGLDYWHLTPHDVRRAARFGMDTDLDKLKERKFKSFHPYRPGWLALHSGLLLHRLGNVSGVTARDERITLQGHGVRIKGTWYLHW